MKYINLQYLSLTAGSCSPDDDNWKFYGGRCFYFGKGNGYERASWWGAKKFCNSKGAFLASIHSSEEQRFLIGQVH